MEKCFCEKFKEYCEKTKDSVYSSMRITGDWWMTRSKEKFLIDTNYDNNAHKYQKIEIKFCPFCGKKLE